MDTSTSRESNTMLHENNRQTKRHTTTTEYMLSLLN